MRVWIDADACPRPVREIVFRASRKRRFPVTLVANKPIDVPKLAWISAVQVPSGLDMADHHIAQHVQPGDLVITQDIPLAAEVIATGATAISLRGETWTEGNIGERLSMRDFLTEARASGVQTGGPPPFDDRAKNQFANALDRWLTRRERAAPSEPPTA